MRWVIVGAIVVGLAFGITQGVIPGHAEKKVRERLTRNGGTADVNIRAIPAVRLLFDDGDELDVHAHGIAIPAQDLRGGSFKELDGFDEMRFEMVRSEVGPFTADRSVLSRGRGEANYDFVRGPARQLRARNAAADPALADRDPQRAACERRDPDPPGRRAEEQGRAGRARARYRHGRGTPSGRDRTADRGRDHQPAHGVGDVAGDITGTREEEKSG
jgi:hypothetical protein